MLYAARFDAYIFGCVPPPLIPPKPNQPSLNEERHSEHTFRMPLFPIYLFIFHYTPKKALLPEKPPPPFPHTAKVAAALSAAVTTTKQQEAAPTLQAEPPMQKQPRRTPASLRERGAGGEAFLSEKRPLPQHLPTPSLQERAQGRGLLYREAPSLASITFSTPRCRLQGVRRLGRARRSAPERRRIPP